jgi:adenylyltransferase/sulfurtransferase
MDLDAVRAMISRGQMSFLQMTATVYRARELKLCKNPDCPGCGQSPAATRHIDYQQFCGLPSQANPNAHQENALINGIPQLTAQQLKQRIDAGEVLYLLDVREPFEYQIANLGGKLIPLNDVPQRLAEVDRNQEVIVHCKSGGRSQAAAEFLQKAGYPKVANLAGGILAWADQIDPKMRKH